MKTSDNLQCQDTEGNVIKYITQESNCRNVRRTLDQLYKSQDSCNSWILTVGVLPWRDEVLRVLCWTPSGSASVTPSTHQTKIYTSDLFVIFEIMHNMTMYFFRFNKRSK